MSQNRIICTLNSCEPADLSGRHICMLFLTTYCYTALALILHHPRRRTFLQRRFHPGSPSSKRPCEVRQCLLTWGRPWACCLLWPRPKLKMPHSLDQMIPSKENSLTLRLLASFLGSFVTKWCLGPRRPWDNFESSVSSGCGQRFTPKSRSWRSLCWSSFWLSFLGRSRHGWGNSVQAVEKRQWPLWKAWKEILGDCGSG